MKLLWLADAGQYFVGTIRHLCRRPYRAVIREGKMPRFIAPKTLYILNEDDDPWQATMRCPCGCGSALEMNLVPDEKAVWRAKVEPDGTGTLHPSVWRQVGCRSHFFIRNGKISWCE